MSTLEQQFNFILELDRLKAVYRQTTVQCDGNRQENSAEHSWHIALLAQTMSEYVEEPINLPRVINMLLLHDVVEIDAGDTFAFADDSELEAQEDKEIAAANRLFGLLPEPQYQQFKQLWLEFEQAQSADARFAKAMDRILPLLQNMSNQGGSWVKHKVKKSQVLARNQYLQGITPKLWQYATEQIDLAVANGWLLDQ